MWQRFLLLTVLLSLSAASRAELACNDWFQALDHALTEAGIHDAGAARIPGYPQLRGNRWLAFLQPRVHGSAQEQLWLSLAEEEARQGWLSELQRLPPTHPLLAGHWRQRLQYCLDQSVAVTGFPGIPAIQVDDDYSRRNRILGIYPLTSLLARPSMNRYREDMAQRFRRPARLPIRHFLVEDFAGGPPTPAALSHNALDLPLPSEGARQALLYAYAPVLSVADTLIYNQPGSIVIDAGTPTVDYRQPAAYSWISWTRYKGYNLLQLNYQFWFSERPKTGSIDLYSGKLDSIIWRVTLKPDGNVLFYDSIHGCGCYHKVYPVARGLAPAAQGPAAPVFYPHLAANANQSRVSLVLEPDTHFIVRVENFVPGQTIERYTLRDANQLRALADGQGGVTSLYDSTGLVPISERGERYLLWPLGVPSPGTMRQPGSHAIAFIGKRHFDDAQLADVLFK